MKFLRLRSPESRPVVSPRTEGGSRPKDENVKNFWNVFGDLLIRWFSSGLRCGQTEAAPRNFETPFLRDEVPLVNADVGRLSAVCQIFLECGNPPTEEKGPALKIFL